MATKYLKLTSGYGGYCLKWVRLCFGVPAKYPTAYAAWQGARRRHTGTPPANVPVFFAPSGNGFGHVAYSLGGGRVRTTNSATNKIHNTTIATIERQWGQRYLGWTEDLNGRTVYAPPKPKPTPPKGSSSVLRRGRTGARVKRLQAGMNDVFPAYSKLAVDGSYGAATERVVKEFQRRAGLAVDGIVGPKTTAALARYGVKL